jgi:hypothetical protein
MGHDGLREVKGYIPWVGKVKRKRVGRKFGIVVGEYQWVVMIEIDGELVGYI